MGRAVVTYIADKLSGGKVRLKNPLRVRSVRTSKLGWDPNQLTSTRYQTTLGYWTRGDHELTENILGVKKITLHTPMAVNRRIV